MAEHAADNRETEDRNLYPLPDNMLIARSADRACNDVIKYYTMKYILHTSLWFIIGFFTVAVISSALASPPPGTTPSPTTECSCGVCEDSR